MFRVTLEDILVDTSKTQPQCLVVKTSIFRRVLTGLQTNSIFFFRSPNRLYMIDEKVGSYSRHLSFPRSKMSMQSSPSRRRAALPYSLTPKIQIEKLWES